MTAPQDSPAVPKPTRLKTRHWFLLPVLLAAPAVAYLNWRNEFVVIAILTAYLALGLVLRSTVVIATLLGALLGVVMDPPVKSGPIDAQVEETAAHLFIGVAMGVIAGFCFDVLLQRSRTERTGTSLSNQRSRAVP